MLFDITICADDPVLHGHYPHAPIFPGVLMLEFMEHGFRRYALDYMSASVTLRKVEKIRFLSPAFPGDELRLQARSRPDGSGFLVTAEVIGATLLAKAVLKFEVEGYAS